jgi:RND family efflux transporter MFP subunit
MNRPALALAFLLAVAALGAGYWWGSRSRPIMASPPTQETAEKPERRIAYYRNPMGLPDISPTPKKDAMGMDYIPVYEGEEPPSRYVRIDTEKIQKLGVKTEAAALRELARPIRAVGTIQVDERRLHALTVRFEGYLERLYVNATGQAIKRGQPVAEIYSPELVAAQREYLVAREGVAALQDADAATRSRMQALAAASLARLRYWQISPGELGALQRDGRVRDTLTLRAPATGVVMGKMVVEGMRVMPGEPLLEIADLSTVWLIADVFEQDLGDVLLGQPAKIRVNAYPGRTFEGRVAFVYPTLEAQSRTARVRVELPNPGGLLKPAMYASVELGAPEGAGRVLTVPTSAVIRSGDREVVLVQVGEGRFEPRSVKLGAEGDDHVQVREGVAEGEKVVVSANFLIDAESNLRAALASFTPPADAAPVNGAPAAAHEHHEQPEHQQHQGHEQPEHQQQQGAEHQEPHDHHDHEGH